jgi:AraC-like DNA-binding protein
MSRARASSRNEKELAIAAARAMLQELLLLLALDQAGHRPARRKERRSETLLDSAKESIEHQFHRPLTVAGLARESGLSRNYFSARFRARFGRTAQGYLLHRRVEAARILLVSTSLPIKEIAFECGIPDPNHFNKQFRHVVGMSPTAYRDRQMEKW